MTPKALWHLASRLSRFEQPRCLEAARQVRQAIAIGDQFGQADAEQALCHAVWGHLEAAIEDADHEVPVEPALGGRRVKEGKFDGWICTSQRTEMVVEDGTVQQWAT